MTFSAVDHAMMARALRLAAKGLWTTTPNPRVGCVMTQGDRIVGEGWHRRAGEGHAEVEALNSAGGEARGATAYVTLEPCSHHGRTPPCCEALVEAGVSRVVAAMVDPNPIVSGRGLAYLQSAGVAVAHGLMHAEAEALNIGFVSRMTRGRPWVRLKVAASLDGKTALGNGRSQWITGPAARRDGHRWRARACAILTGVGTIRDDNPRLTVREVETPRQPLRVIVDSLLETPLDANVFSDGSVLVAAAVPDLAKMAVLAERGVEVVVLPDTKNKVDLPALMRELGRRGINELHVEAGFKLNGSLVREGMVDEFLIYQAPSLIGHEAAGMFNLPPLTELAGRCNLRVTDVRYLGGDLRIRARLA